MRTVFHIVVIAAVAAVLGTPRPGQAQVQARCGCDHPSHCQAPPVCPPENPRDFPPPSSPRGGYVAPPRSGVQIGESSGYGVTGFGLHFPELYFRLPTLKLPNLVQYRGAPKMILDSAVAPYVEEVQREEYGERALPPDEPDDRDFPPPHDKNPRQAPHRQAPHQQATYRHAAVVTPNREMRRPVQTAQPFVADTYAGRPQYSQPALRPASYSQPLPALSRLPDVEAQVETQAMTRQLREIERAVRELRAERRYAAGPTARPVPAPVESRAAASLAQPQEPPQLFVMGEEEGESDSNSLLVQLLLIATSIFTATTVSLLVVCRKLVKAFPAA